MKKIDKYLTKLDELNILEKEYKLTLKESEKIINLLEQKSTALKAAGIAAPLLLPVLISYLVFLYKSKRDIPLQIKLRDFITNTIGDKTLGKIITVREFKTKDPNAFCHAGRALFYTSGLKDILNEREMIAVLLHEYRHFKSLDVYTNFISRVGMLALLAKIFSRKIPKAITVPVVALYFFLIIFTTGIPYKLLLGRMAELRADSLPARYGYAEDLISALKKLAAYYKTHEVKSFLFKVVGRIDRLIVDEHPSLAKRIENILKTEEMYKGPAISRVAAVKGAIKQNLGG